MRNSVNDPKTSREHAKAPAKAPRVFYDNKKNQENNKKNMLEKPQKSPEIIRKKNILQKNEERRPSERNEDDIEVHEEDKHEEGDALVGRKKKLYVISGKNHFSNQKIREKV